jgi:glucans biosynthesis protein
MHRSIAMAVLLLAWAGTGLLRGGEPAVAPSASAPASTGSCETAEKIEERARDLAARPDAAPDCAVPEAIAKATYNQYLEIHPDLGRALWSGAETPFRVAFYPRGYIYPCSVEIDQVIDGHVEPVRFAKDLFTWGSPELKERAPGDLGFAGLRILGPLNQPDKLDEVISFLGASYFRALGRGQFYGASARGLALDTGTARDEEFPSFRKFWIVRPAPADRSVVIHALLDGPSVAGAYRFEVRPGDDTTVEVRATLHFRRKVEVIGLAPLTSMFLFGENEKKPSFSSDPRPQVHDSDHLVLGNEEPGSLTWQPLEHPDKPRITRFPLPRDAGFGLWQRDRNPDHYRDGCHYELRPGIWVEPLDPWPAGSVTLLELPADGEWRDNIACFYEPRDGAPVGAAYRFHYRLHFRLDPPGPPGGRTAWKP